MKRFHRFLLVVGIGTFFIGFLGSIAWYFDVFSHFRIYFVGYFLLCLSISIVIKRKLETIISGVFFLFTLISITKFYFGNVSIDNFGSIKIGAINLLSSNVHYNAVTKFIAEEDFDIVLLQEVTPEWEKQLDTNLVNYSTKIFDARKDNFGIGMLVKGNPLLLEIMEIGNAEIPSIIAKLRHENLVIIGTHPLPPVGSKYFKLRNDQYDALNTLVKSIGSEIMIIGDLNTSSFSPNFNKIIDGTSLRDSRLGFGLQPSWNAMFSWIAVPIDHALVSEGVEVLDRRLGPNVDSDHYPIIIEISMKNSK